MGAACMGSALAHVAMPHLAPRTSPCNQLSRSRASAHQRICAWAAASASVMRAPAASPLVLPQGMPLADAPGLCLPPAPHRWVCSAQHATLCPRCNFGNTRCSLALQGSGWGWLGYNKANGALEIATCANQDPLSTKVGGVVGRAAQQCACRAARRRAVNAMQCMQGCGIHCMHGPATAAPRRQVLLVGSATVQA